MNPFRAISLHLALVDVVLEVVDARIPATGRNPALRPAIGTKPALVVLNKADLVNPGHLREWLRWYARSGEKAYPVSALKKFGLVALVKAAREVGGGCGMGTSGSGGRPSGTRAEGIGGPDASSGSAPDRLRMMVVGIPNSGKSSLINALLGAGVARVGSKPGVTRGHQWLKGSFSMRKAPRRQVLTIEILDLPGVIPVASGGKDSLPDERSRWKLAAVGALYEGQFDVESCARDLLLEIAKLDPDTCLAKLGRGGREILASESPLKDVAISLGHIAAGGVPDLERAGRWLLGSFARGDLGRFALELPP